MDGPQRQANQDIVQGLQHDADSRANSIAWSDDSDVPQDELDDLVADLKSVNARESAAAVGSVTGPGTQASEGPSKPLSRTSGQSVNRRGSVLHVVFVVDASLSMATRDMELPDGMHHMPTSPQKSKKKGKGREMEQPQMARRIDAVFHACQAFLAAQPNPPAGTKDLYSLIVFNRKSHFIFNRLSKQEADDCLELVHDKVSPARETHFQSAFKMVHRFLGNESASEHVHIVLLSDGVTNAWVKSTIAATFDEEMLNTARVQGALGFTVHVVGFGCEPGSWQNLWPIAQATGGTCQEVGLNHLELRRVFTSVAVTITSDRCSFGGPPLRAAALEIPFDPLLSGQTGCKRTCSRIKHSYQKLRWQLKDVLSTSCRSIDVFVEQLPFGFGGMRVFYGMIEGSSTNVSSSMVAKRLVQKPHATMEDMLPFCRCTSLAISLRQSFLQALKRTGREVKLWFVPCYLYTYQRIEGGEAYVVFEQRLDGKFVKFNGNNGYVNPEDGSDIMQAFSHFTFLKTWGTSMVVDLQGVVDNGSYLLTDPQVLSRKQCDFGRGDLGYEGIRAFFDSHDCGETCVALGLPGKEHEILKVMRLQKERRCQICMDAPSKTVLVPCGHSAVCKTCAMRLFEEEKPVCPICRHYVKEFKPGVYSTTFVRPEKRNV